MDTLKKVHLIGYFVYNEKKRCWSGNVMTKRLLTKKEQEQLKRNPNVIAVSDKAITYTDEFKRHFIAQNEQGKLPRDIFEEAGLDVECIGLERVRSSGKRWRASYREAGVEGLQDTRKTNSGRPSERELTLEQKIERLEAKNQLLRAENELLKKLDLLERQMLKKK